MKPIVSTQYRIDRLLVDSQKNNRTKLAIHRITEYQAFSEFPLKYFASYRAVHFCPLEHASRVQQNLPVMGASAQVCSTFMP